MTLTKTALKRVCQEAYDHNIVANRIETPFMQGYAAAMRQTAMVFGVKLKKTDALGVTLPSKAKQ
jgi:hypothetical protein